MYTTNPEKLLPLLKSIETSFTLKDKINPKISSSRVAWHLDHTLKVFNLVSESLINSNPKGYSTKFNKYRLLFFTLGRFPRGKVKAPKIARPPEIILQEDLTSQLNLACTNIEFIKGLDNNAHFKHFIFGVLNKGRTIRFLELHTKHHLKIIRDILEK